MSPDTVSPGAAQTPPGTAQTPPGTAQTPPGAAQTPPGTAPSPPGTVSLPPPGVVATASVSGQDVVFCDRARYHDTVEAYRAGGYEMLGDLCVVDYLANRGRSLPDGVEGERFEVVVELLSIAHVRRVRVRTQVPEDDPTLDSLWDLYPGAEAMEREAFDMFGIRFGDHPDLSRILMPEDWEGHPLRKDYGVGRVPVQFKAAPGPR